MRAHVLFVTGVLLLSCTADVQGKCQDDSGCPSNASCDARLKLCFKKTVTVEPQHPDPVTTGTIQGEAALDDVAPDANAGITVKVDGSSTTATTTSTGAYSIGIKPGTYTVVATRDGYKEARASVTVEIGVTAKPSGLLLHKLSAVGRIEGQVNLEGAPDGSGVEVSLVGTSLRTISGPGGVYALEGVAPNNYTLTLARSGYTRAEQSVLVHQDQTTTAATVTLAKAKITTDVLAATGAIFTINGTGGFGVTRGASTVEIGGVSASEYLSWSDTQIVARVPRGALLGIQPVVVNTSGSQITGSARVIHSVPMSAQGNSYVVQPDGKIKAWGEYNSFNQLAIPTTLSNVVAVAAGSYTVIALSSNGTVTAWGANTNGEADVPTAARSGVVAISAGSEWFAALTSDGRVVVWGYTPSNEQIVPPEARSGVAAIATGAHHVLALKTDGSVIGWGSNKNGQVSIPIAAMSGVVGIAAGGGHSTAIKSDGSVLVWGDDLYHQNAVPADIGSVAAVSEGDFYSILALRKDGTVRGWGLGQYRELNVPAQLSDVAAIETGEWGMAVKTDGTLVEWGGDDGIGHSYQAAKPPSPDVIHVIVP
jgi:hypothetical protein